MDGANGNFCQLTPKRKIRKFLRKFSRKSSIHKHIGIKVSHTHTKSVPNKVRVCFMRFYPGAVYVRVVATLPLRK